MTFRWPDGQYHFERIPLSQNIEYRVMDAFMDEEDTLEDNITNAEDGELYPRLASANIKVHNPNTKEGSDHSCGQ